MTDQDIDEIESRLGLEVPDDYREFATSYPVHLGKFAGQYELFDDCDRVIFHTLERRLRATDEQPWSDDHLVIGASGCGDAYYMDLGQKPSPVLFASRDAKVVQTAADSLADWCDQLVQLYGCEQ
jgi:hypothetical protein